MGNKIISTIIFIVLLVTMIHFIIQYIKKSKQNIRLETDNLRLQAYLFEKPVLKSEDLIIEIDVLIEKYNYCKDTLEMLKRTKDLYIEGHKEEAITKLVVVIENKIKQTLEVTNDGWFSKLNEKRKKYIKHSELIERVRKLEILNDLQFNIVKKAISIRNAVSHSVNYTDDKKILQICYLGCIEVLVTLVKYQENPKLDL